MTIHDLHPTEYGPFYANYLKMVPEGMSLTAALEESAGLVSDYLLTLPADRENFAYAPGKWTIKQSLQHLIDTDRIFAYRALRLGRRDATPLPGFDQDDYAATARVELRDFQDMRTEFESLRRTTVSLFRGFSGEELAFIGTASGHPMSCRAMGMIMAGHTYHHHKVFLERYR